MFKTLTLFSHFHRSTALKRLQGLVTAGLFLTGNLVSTLPAIAAPTPSSNIVVDTTVPVNQRPTLDVTHNGVDQVNIVHPNNAGLSHNKFTQYNVNEQGQILNNSPTITNTKLAGQITGNPHLKDGSSAKVILNEVTGYSPTKLLGHTEVAGKQASVIIANPSGITCAGCGFINTTRTSLATGRANLDANGNLQSLTISQGEIGFDGKGGNFAEVPVLDIISRKVRINAPINGQDIRVIAGRNTVDYATGTATPLNSDGSQTPEFAIETSALGGMTGNHIQMLVNEKGAGVRVDGRMASTAGDMQLTADGKLVVSGELNAQNNLNARVDVVENTGTIGANNGVSLQANGLTNTGRIVATGDQGSNTIAIANTVDNSGTITTRSTLGMNAKKVNNQKTGTINSQKDLTITSNNLGNAGTISSDSGILKATIDGDISNSGSILANNHIALTTPGNIDNTNGKIVADQSGTVNIQGNSLTNQGGLIQSNAGNISVNTNSLNNNFGSIVTNNAAIDIYALQYFNNTNGQIGSQQSGGINLVTQGILQNSNGKIASNNGDIVIQSNRLTNSSGKIVAGANNTAGNLTLIGGGDVDNSNGIIQATAGSVTASIGKYTDTGNGVLYAGTALDVNASGDMFLGGAIQSKDNFSIRANSLNIANQKASISSLNGNGSLTIANALTNNGTIAFSKGSLNLSAGSFANGGTVSIGIGGFNFNIKGDFSNKNGSLVSDSNDVTITALGMIDNTNGKIGVQNNGNVTITSQNLINQNNGLIHTGAGDITLNIGSLSNQSGNISTNNGNVDVHASGGVNNSSGRIGSQVGGNVTITASGDISNNNGQITSPVGYVSIIGNSLENSSGQIGSDDGGVNVNVYSGKFTNSLGKLVAGTKTGSGNELTLQSGDVENSGGVIQATSGSVKATIGAYTDTGSGVLYAGKDLSLNASGDMSVGGAIQSQNKFLLTANSLNVANSNASISSIDESGSLTVANALINNGSISFLKGGLELLSGSLSNSGSIKTGDNGFNLKIKGDFSNQNGSLITNSNNATITANGTLNNSNGQIGVQNNGNVTITSQNLVNQNNGLIRTGTGDVILNVGSLSNQSGSILTNVGQISVNATNDINNAAGKISIQGQSGASNNSTTIPKYNIAISAGGSVDNQQGQIINQLGGIQLTANSLNNSNEGQIGSLSQGDIHLDLQNGFLNNSGKVITPSGELNLNLHNGKLENIGGELITSSGNLILHSGDVDNSGGVIKANSGSQNANSLGNVTATIGGYTDRGNGVVYADTLLTINASGDLSVGYALQGNQGLSLTAKSLTLNGTAASVSSLKNNGQINVTNSLVNSGQIFVGNGALTIDAGSVVNKGQINTNAGLLSITAYDGGISNNAGKILTNNDVITLTALGAVDNSSGQIGSLNNGDITIKSGDLNNQAGKIVTGIGNLSLTVGSLTNNSGFILNQQGDVGIAASGNVTNNSGQIGVQGNTSGNLTIAAAGDIQNKQGALVTPVGLVNITGKSLDNTAGSIGSNTRDVNINTHTGKLTNTSGVIVAGTIEDPSNLTLQSGDVENSGGVIRSTSGALNATIGGYTDTGSGVLYAGKDLVLNASGEMSVGGIVQSQKQLTLTANSLNVTNPTASVNSIKDNASLTITNNIVNSGSISALQGLDIKASNIMNTGSLTGMGSLTLKADQSVSNHIIYANEGNEVAGGIIRSEGDIALTASTFDNTGYIQSLAGVGLQITGLMSNQSLGENSGVILSGSNHDIQITAGTLQNTNGQIVSGNDLGLTLSNSLDNSGVLQAAKSVNIKTPSLNNNAGRLLSLNGDLSIGALPNGNPTVIDNTNGKIQSNQNIILQGSSYQSSDQSLLTALQSLQANFTGAVTNEGQFVGNNGLNLTANSLTNGAQSLLYSGNQGLTLNISGQSGLDNEGQIQTLGDQGSLIIQAENLTNKGSIISKNGAEFKIQQSMNNQRDGDIYGKIINQGGNLIIAAPMLKNDGLIISPNTITLTSQTLNNTGYVSADGLLKVDADQINNSEALSGLPYEGQTLVSGSLIANNTQLSAQNILNQSGWIQGTTGLTLTADTITNTQRAGSTAKGVILSTNGDVTLQGVGSTADNVLPTTSVSNDGGILQANNRLWVSTKNLDNTNGVLTSQKGQIQLDQGSSGAALETFKNNGGSLQSASDLTLSFSQLDSAEGSRIIAGGILSLTVGSDFTNKGILWGGKGLELIVSALVNNANAKIGADQGNVHINAQNGSVTNYGQIQNIASDRNLVIQASSLTNDGVNGNGNGTILSNSNIDLQVTGSLINQNKGEITAFNKGAISFNADNLQNSWMMLAGGTLNGTVANDIHNSTNGYLYGEDGLTLTSNTSVTNANNGQIGTGSGALSLSAPIITLEQGGQIISGSGSVSLNASNSVRNAGWVQSMKDMQISTPTLDNTSGVLLSKAGQISIENNGAGLSLFTNNNGTIQAANDLTIYTHNLQNQSGTILTYDALGAGNLGDITLYGDAQKQPLETLDLSNGGIIQSSKNIYMAVNPKGSDEASGLSQTGKIIANQILDATINGDFANNNVIFASLGNIVAQTANDNRNPGVYLTVNGNYTINADEGLSSKGDLSVKAKDIINNDALVAANDVIISANSLTNNATGFIYGMNNLKIDTSGNIDNNQGVLQTDQGSMNITAGGDVTNIGGLIRAQGEKSDITIQANSFTNKHSGTLGPVKQEIVYERTYDTAVNAVGQPLAGMTNQQIVAEEGLDIGGWKPTDVKKYFYGNDVKVLKLEAPEGMFKADGKPATGSVYWFLSEGANNPKSKIVIKGTADVQTLIDGTPATLSAGRDLTIRTNGAIENNVSHIQAGGNMNLYGSSLNNVGITSNVTYTFLCANGKLCRYFPYKDQSKTADPLLAPNVLPGDNKPTIYVIATNRYNQGLSSTIVAGKNLIGDFSGQVNNTTIINNALASDFAKPDAPSKPSIQNQDTTKGQEGKDGLTGAGNSNLSSGNSSDTNAQLINGQSANLPGYSGIISPQGVDPSLHVSLPGFSGTGSASISDILSAITGGQALFKPAQHSVTSGGSNIHSTSGGSINGGSGGATNIISNSTLNTNGSGGGTSNGSLNPATNANVGNITVNVPTNNPSANTVTASTIPVNTQSQQGNVNTTPLQPTANYLIETKPAYISVTQFYGSQYLLDRLSINGSYMFLGDAGFDSTYIQQQYIQATGQSYPGGTYMTASNAMKTMLNNAVDAQSKLGLQFGTALTKEQQAALDEDIVWYVPVVVDGKTVLAPQLYLSPKTDILAGASIKGKNVDITAGSINNSGLMQGTESIALTATNGDISNIGGTIKGGKISLNAQNGSVINADTVNTYLVNGGTGSYLGSQGQIIGTGTVGIKASDSITTHGGTIQSGSDLAMQASTINIGAAQLNASASSVTYASDGTLKFKGNQTLNYGTTITSGGNASLQSTGGDLTFSGSSLSAQGSVSLASAGSIGLNAVTNSGFSDVKGKKSGAFNSSSFQNTNAYTTQQGSSISAKGDITMVAKHDISLAGSAVLADGSASLLAGNDINLDKVTNTSSSYASHKSSSLLQKEGVKQNTTQTEEIGSLVGAGKNVSIIAGNNFNLAGTVTGQNDVSITAGNTLTTTALKDTTSDYYHKNKSGIGASFSGGMASIGYMSDKRTETSNTTTWTPSEISAGNNLSLVSGGAASFTGTNLSAANDLSISGSSVSFNTVQNTADQTYKHSSVFVGAKVGASSYSAAGSAAQYGQAAADMSGSGSAAGKTLNAMQAGYSVGKGLADMKGDVTNLISGTAQLGFNVSKYKSEYSQSNVVGSSATAGNTLSVVARGDNANDAHNGDITATAAKLAGNDVTLSGNNVTLQNGWDTTHQQSKGSSYGGAVGVEFGKDGLSVVASGNGSKQRANGDSATAVNTIVTATNQVSITAPGKTTLNGATVSGNRVTVDTGNLDIITPQDTSHYNSSTSQAGFNVKAPVPGAGKGWSVGANYGNQKIKDDYQSTGKTQSGIYAGNDGLAIHVGDTTHLKGGVISSTADASKNSLDTHKLITEDLQNHSKWDATSVGGGLNIGSDSFTGTAGVLGVIAGNMAANSGLITGTQRKHNETSTTQSAISSNIGVNAGSTEGSYSTDVSNANKHLENNFNADKLNNQLQASQIGMQLVGEVMGQISDALHDKGIPGFDETKLSNDWGRILLEAGGSAAIAGATGGNVGAATASSVGGNIATASSFAAIKQWAKAQSNGDEIVATLLTNAIENVIASAGGAAAGGIVGGSSGVINGVGISSATQQYNQARAIPKEWLAAAAGGVALNQAGQKIDLDQAITDLVNSVYNAFPNSDNAQAKAQAAATMFIVFTALVNSLPSPEQISQKVNQTSDQVVGTLGDFTGLLEQYAATNGIPVSSEMTAVSEGDKFPTSTGHPAPDLSWVPTNTGNQDPYQWNWWDGIFSTPIPQQDKYSGVIADPIIDTNKGWIETFPANSDASKSIVFAWTADDKIKGQMGDRGWTGQDIDAAIAAGPTGTSTDNRRPNKTPDGLGRSDPATVYGKPGNYVVINNRTGEVIQVSNKNVPDWADDGRIKWNQ